MKTSLLTSNWVQIPLAILLLILIFFYLKAKLMDEGNESSQSTWNKEMQNDSFRPLTQITILNPQIKVGDVASVNEAFGYIQLVNSGLNPLFLDHIETSCDCTTGEFKEAEVKPGDTLSIKVNYIKRKTGYFYQDIMLYGNFSDSPAMVSIEGSFH